MNKPALLFLSLLLLLAGCATAPKNTLTQVSTIDALLAGVYDGQITLGELKKHGDLGIGTFDALEGEMIQLDTCSRFYMVLTDHSAFAHADLAKDRSHELEKVEK